jgi:hypothetical protein
MEASGIELKTVRPTYVNGFLDRGSVRIRKWTTMHEKQMTSRALYRRISELKESYA